MEKRYAPFALADRLDAEPDGRDTTNDRDLLRLDEIHDVAGLRVRSREELRCAHHEAGIGGAPRVGVEHRHYVQDHLLFGQRKSARLRHGEAVEVDRAVRVDDAFRVSDRAGRVAPTRGSTLVELRPVHRRRAQAEEIRIREDAWR